MALTFILIPAAFVASRFLGVSGGLKESACGWFLASVLIWAGRRHIHHGSIPAVIKPFQSRPMRFAGQISYSVYLLHSPLLGLANLLLLPLPLETLERYMVLTFVAVPVVLGICYLFYLLVERHFLNSHQQVVHDGDIRVPYHQPVQQG